MNTSQKTIRERCFHPTGTFVEFKKEDIEQSIPQRFENMVRLCSNRLAIRSQDCEMTYDQMNRAANRVAHTILDLRGANAEPVAVLMEHGVSMIIGILGVLKAGKFYVPLDSSYPHEKLTHILQDSEAGFLITDNNELSLAESLVRDNLGLTNIDESNTTYSDENPGLSISPDAISWIHYTSGSTGQSKGVVQNHRNALHFIVNYTNGLHVCPEDRLTHVNRGIQDPLSALLKGASVFPLDVRKEGLAQFADWLVREEITIYHSFPTIFRHFLHHLTDNKNFANLRVICLEGEPVYRNDFDLYKRYFSSGCIFVNRLGGTEARSIAWNFLEMTAEISDGTVPVGYAFNDSEVQLLDENKKPVASGTVGEIAVKSRYLALGYWRRPDLTEAKFLSDPNGGNIRTYLTGDLGCITPDGCLSYLGRKDYQVKIRGYRVELSEIETILLGLETLKEAVVVYDDRRSEPRLVAYLVSNVKPAPSTGTLRKTLADRLPDYMVPSTFVFLDALPLTHNGKVNRRALPVANNNRPELDTPFVSPQSAAEEELVKIWAEVLGLDRVGIQDNFLELGGHSLLATRVVSKVVEQFRAEVSIQSLFQSPTVAEMAKVIARQQKKTLGEEELVRILAELDSLSEEEANRLVSSRSDSTKRNPE